MYNSAGTLIGASSNARKLVVYDQTGGTYYIRVSSTVSSSTIQYTVRAKVYPYTAYIMQGNTKDALDCETIYYDLQDNNYSSTSIGWTLGNTGQAYITPVTTSEFANAKIIQLPITLDMAQEVLITQLLMCGLIILARKCIYLGKQKPYQLLLL